MMAYDTGRGKAPLYRKENKTAYGFKGNRGDDYCNSRHTKQTRQDTLNEVSRLGMKGKVERGRDYTPLFRFLLSKVGKDWDEVHSEAVSRLDKKAPIFWMVAIHEAEKRELVCMSESAYWSGLYVDENNILQKVNPELTIHDIYPYCACCTHTFNGELVTNKYDDGRVKLSRRIQAL